MNKEKIIKYLKNSIDEKGNYCYSLPMETTKAIIKYIDQLSNNWNELEEFIKKEMSDGRSKDNLWLMGCYDEDKKILGKINEIKEKNNVKD